MIERIVKEVANAPANSRLYLGADSIRYTRKNGDAWAKITTVAVLHIAGRHGCKVIGENQDERIFDKRLDRPQYRMMQECYKLSELYLNLEEALLEADLEIPIELHLDIATDPQHGSNCAAKQAAGYILGVCGVKPVLKPVAWAASTAADLFTKKLVA